ncbi:OmpA family protein [Zavarzinia compransoris]|uniref:OmpA-like domain-containing protein n=1 Tax=Zavarzinia compransoris TaxID=1264899 RepID=A0A317ECC0_9PROT|nr:OmpA family protein [Zavarzinia compransoris]PWR23944.1 hypothetical protein DKG75_05180 [Zavarzinia compransoris]TDP48191.1 outer membrane protein OmpA-like peptidoglycan-associated protein [Zavarzinia compransoris]
MRLALGLVSAAAIIVAGAAAQADMVSGPYVTGFGGYTINPDVGVDSDTNPSGHLSFDHGWVGGAAVGYDFGRARIEFEGAYRKNNYDELQLGTTTFTSDSDLAVISGLVNVLYDFENESVITPFIGFGIGAAYLDDDNSDTVLAYQGIAGAKISVTENLSAVVDYRYFRTLETDIGTNIGNLKFEYEQHTITAGLSYNFGTPAPAPVVEPAPAVVPPPAVEAARSYMVFFDWDSTAITPDASQIIRDAASAAQTLGVTRIELTGHADRSGSPRYNQRLSLKRADAVKAELIALGVAADSISTVGKGESAPLVPTPDGVREAQNRRVEIVLP